MKKRFATTAFVLMLVLFISGLVMVFSSTKMGQNEGRKAMQANGGSIDTQKYYTIIDSTSENFRSAGIIISLIGGLGLLISGYGIYNEI